MSDLILLDKSLKKEDRQQIETDIFNYRSKELFINLSEKDIPPKGHKDRNAFIDWEEEKCLLGITVNGIFIPPTFYWDICHWAIMKDVKDSRGIKKKIPVRPSIRDNDWLIHQALYEAEQAFPKQNLLIGSARQVSKSKNIASVFGCDLMLHDGRINLLMASAEIYLTPILEYLQVGTENCTEFFRVPRITKDKKSKLWKWGFKTKEGEDIVKSMLHIRNAQEGKNTEVAAGVTIDRSAIDEIAVFPYRSSYETILPALIDEEGVRSSSICAFCVCEGTKVWNNKGDFKNIEDLSPDEGIIGFDINNEKFSQESISYYQEPFEKLCYRITTISGRTLECSYDHPIYTRDMYSPGRYKKSAVFKQASSLLIDECIAVSDGIDIWGEKEFEDGKLIGWLVGDGTYGIANLTKTKKNGTPISNKSINLKLSNADPEIWEYLENKYTVRHDGEDKFTKDGRQMRKSRILGISDQIRNAGIEGQTKDNKRLPKDIHSYTKKSVCEFLGGYFDADGNVYIDYKTNRCQVKISSANIEILKETQFILQKLGIQSKLYWCKPNFNNPKTTRGHWNLNINDKGSLINFYENIQFTIKYKQEKLEEIYNLKLNSVKPESSYIKGLKWEKIKKIEEIGYKKVYNLTADNTNTYFANGIFTHNTGGNSERSKDAEESFMNPAAGRFKSFENDAKSTGFFMGGWYRQDLKEEKNFGEWLGVKDKTSELHQMKIRISDFEKANKILDEEEALAAKSNDPGALIKQKMYNPRKISDMFLTPNVNPFDIDALQRQLEWLKDNYSGIPVELYLNEHGDVKWNPSNKKPILEYPTPKDTNLDAPIVIYDFPKHTEHYSLHISGFDAVNNLEQNANSDSLASIFVMRRNHTDINDPFRNCIVAEYTARPRSFTKDYMKNVELLQKFYNMQILHEDSGNGVTLYFDQKQKSHVLMDTFNLQRAMNPMSKANNVKGLKANKANNAIRLEVLVNYMEEELEDGRMGHVRIPSPGLIRELIAFDGMGEGSRNTDRIDAFSYALLQCTSLEKFNKTRPFITHQKIDDKPKQKLRVDAFGRVVGTKRTGNFFQF